MKLIKPKDLDISLKIYSFSGSLIWELPDQLPPTLTEALSAIGCAFVAGDYPEHLEVYGEFSAHVDSDHHPTVELDQFTLHYGTQTIDLLPHTEVDELCEYIIEHGDLCEWETDQRSSEADYIYEIMKEDQ